MTDLVSLTEDWRAVARYTVYRTEGYASQRTEIRTILHSDQTYSQATANVALAEKQLQQEPNYRPEVMSRALIGMQLERPIETRRAYLARRQETQRA